MANFSYEEITAATAHTLRALAEESAGKLSEENQSWWDMGRGALRLWEHLAGDGAGAVDHERLRMLLNKMPGAERRG
jgi:hypothetical protein